MEYYKLTEKKAPSDQRENAGARMYADVQQVLSDADLSGTWGGIDTVLMNLTQGQVEQIKGVLLNLNIEPFVPFGAPYEKSAV
jgi:hypothetical protein